MRLYSMEILPKPVLAILFGENWSGILLSNALRKMFRFSKRLKNARIRVKTRCVKLAKSFLTRLKRDVIYALQI